MNSDSSSIESNNSDNIPERINILVLPESDNEYDSNNEYESDNEYDSNNEYEGDNDETKENNLSDYENNKNISNNCDTLSCKDILENSLDNIKPNECIICLEKDNLIKNLKCDCIFYYHPSCYAEWLFQTKNYSCILCKKEIDFNCPEPSKNLITKMLTNNNVQNINIQYCCDKIDNLFNGDLKVFLISLLGIFLIITIVFFIR